MKIYLVDKKRCIMVTYYEALAILASGLQPHEWTSAAIQKYLM